LYCNQCGTPNIDGARFCTGCGANLLNQTAPSPTAPTPPVAEAAALDATRTRDGGLTDTPESVHAIPADTVRPGVALGGRYLIAERLGSGGMGEVWRAADAELGIDVAIKVLPHLLARSPRSIARLKQEAAIALKLTHPNICRLYNLHSDGEVKFLVMEYIAGQTLEDVLNERDEARMGWDDLEPIARQLGRALDYAHGLDPPVLHRDIKPANVMIDPAGRGRLLDFGIAREMRDSLSRVTGRQDSPGTIPYMSPEQFRGERVDRRSDIYSYCLVLYEALAGMPFVSPIGSFAWQVQEKLFEPLEGVPDHLNAILASGLAKDRNDRPASVADLLEGAGTGPVAVPGRAPAAAEAVEQAARQRSAEIRPADGLPERITLECGSRVALDAVLIEGGTFLMGSPDAEAERDRCEGPQREVTITRPFYMGIHQVTQQQYEAVMGANPSFFRGSGNPVEFVSWNDATEFCRALSRRTGRKVRLPTEAEWEYACRAGTRTPFHTGRTIATDEANYDGTYVYGPGRKGKFRETTTAVGSFEPNAFALHDMHGNVWEWCSDRSSDSYARAGSIDPKGTESGSSRVLRGGAWSIAPASCRSAARSWIRPARRRRDIGFRVVVEA